MISNGHYQLDEDMPLFLIDFYKHGHFFQYPKGLARVWVNFTPRSSRVPGETGCIFFGLQRFIKKVLLGEFQKHFFERPWADIEREYRLVMRETLGFDGPVEHIRRLYNFGRLPLKIYALPEGTYVPLNVPAAVIVNTEDWAFWLPNYIETMMSNDLWGPCTSASTARRYRRVFERHAIASGETDLSFVDWMGHDFSFRGLMGREAAKQSGMGHLLFFKGTDTLPAILDAVKYYDASLNCGGSVNATEHSVMCAGSKEGEEETIRRLIEDVYPKGVVSIVSDTWDLWNVLGVIVPHLKSKILARGPNGLQPAKVVFRPDSGDPVKILTGDDDAPYETPQYAGALQLLAASMGTESRAGGRLINKAGLIYGDSITVERAEQILFRTRGQGFSPFNLVFGIGSYTYQYVTRDTYNFAFKATAIQVGDKVEAIFKDPITDNAHKKSHRGIPAVYRGLMGQGDVAGKLYVEETLDPLALNRGAFQRVFFNSQLLVDENFEKIRERARATL